MGVVIWDMGVIGKIDSMMDDYDDYPPKVYSNMVHLKMAPWNRRFHLEIMILRFHVKLGECT